MLKDLYTAPYSLPPSYDLDKEDKIDSNTLTLFEEGEAIPLFEEGGGQICPTP